MGTKVVTEPKCLSRLKIFLYQKKPDPWLGLQHMEFLCSFSTLKHGVDFKPTNGLLILYKEQQ